MVNFCVGYERIDDIFARFSLLQGKPIATVHAPKFGKTSTVGMEQLGRAVVQEKLKGVGSS